MLYYTTLKWMNYVSTWVIKTREEYGKRADLGTHTGLQNEGKEVRDLTNCDKKLWKVVVNIQLYETDRYCIHLHSNVVPVILLSIFYYRKVLESEHEWVNDHIINATQNLTKCLYGTPGLYWLV